MKPALLSDRLYIDREDHYAPAAHALNSTMFEQLSEIVRRPAPFSEYTAPDLWNDPHIAGRMLAFHLEPSLDVASRNHEFIGRSAEWMTSRFGLGPGASAIDFGCGPGLYAERLARLGMDVTGIDFSSNSIRHAREHARSEGLDIEYVEANYLEFTTDRRFDLAVMIMCDFCALSPDQRAVMLDTFRSVLAPGGTVVLDVYSPGMFGAQEESVAFAPNLMDGFWADSEYHGFQQTFKYEQELLLLDKYTIVEPARTRTIYNWLQCFTPAALEREFRDHGLRITERVGSVAGDPYDPDSTEFAVAAAAA